MSNHAIVIIAAAESETYEIARLGQADSLSGAITAARAAGYDVIENACETNDTWSPEREDGEGNLARPTEHLVVVKA